MTEYEYEQKRTEMRRRIGNKEPIKQLHFCLKYLSLPVVIELTGMPRETIRSILYRDRLTITKKNAIIIEEIYKAVKNLKRKTAKIRDVVSKF